MVDALTLEKIQHEKFEYTDAVDGAVYVCPRCRMLWEYNGMYGEWQGERTNLLHHPARRGRKACYDCVVGTPTIDEVKEFVDDLDKGYAKAVGGYLFNETEQSTAGVDYQVHEDVYRHLLETDEGFADYLKYDFIGEKRVRDDWEAFVLEAME